MASVEHRAQVACSRDGPAGAEGWRRGRLVAAGFPTGLAARLARDACYDLHRLIELAERGCPPELAARILAPLDDGGRAG